MSKTIDQRVVEMRFDNSKFESNVRTSMSTLDKLKQKLNLRGASRGLEEVEKASKRFNMNGITSAVETVQTRFSALQVVGVTALANIANQAVNTGKRMISALTIDPIKTGFQEYETQIGSIQTILANTESKGSTLQDVNRALAELNEYADKTIYNFTEMTRNIGTFTAAGVDLETSVSSIKGIANLAAISGSTSQQASSAMYQLSQALAAGKVSLMDWNSVVNAGMGGEVFQTALKRTATQMGQNVDAMIEKYGSFRESLTQGNWLTTEVLTETLTQLSGAYSKADLIAKGYTEEQANQITKLAETAVSAATEVKTFTQLWDTLKEAAQSGWTQTWQTIVGDFGEAKELLTGINNVVSGMISSSADARNKFLTEGLSTGWKQLLNQGIEDEDRFKESIKSVAKERGLAIDQMIEDAGSFEKMLKSGKITGDMLTESLDNMTTKVSKMSVEELKAAGYTSEQVKKLEELNKAVKDGSISMDEFAKKMVMPSGRENLIAGMANIFKTLGEAIKPIKDAFRDIFPPMVGNQLYKITERFKELTEQFKVSEETASKIKRTFSGVFAIFDLFGKSIKTLVSPFIEFATNGAIGNAVEIILSFTASIGDFFTTINESAGAGKFFEGLTSGITTMASKISNALGIAKESLNSFGGVLSFIGNIIGSAVGKIGQGIKWIADTLSIGDIFAGLAGGGIFLAAKKFAGLFDKIKEVINGFFDNARDKISISQRFSDVLESVHDSLASFSSGIKATTLLTIAGAVGILSASLRSLSGINPGNLIMSLGAIGSMMFMLNFSFKSITSTLNKFGGAGSIKAGFALIGMATAIKILSDALIKISDIDFDNLVKGLITLSAGMIALTSSLKLIDKAKISLKTSVAIIALAQSCKILSSALSEFGKLSQSEIKQGLVAMGGALIELVATISMLNKTGGIKSVFSSTGLLIATASLSNIAESLKNLGNLTWEQIKIGLSAMGGALAELTASLGILSYVGGFGSILGGTSILIAVQALDEISSALSNLGNLTWEQIKIGLSAMGGALTELSIIVGTLGTVAPIGGLLGSGAILLGVQGLVELSNAFSNFASMSWEEIKIGLVGMGGALSEVAVITGLLGNLGGLGSLLGSGSLLLGIQGLGDLAKALKEFGSMSWEEIGSGLTAMGAALGETALGGILNTFSGLGAMSISEIAEPLGVLADSVKKWSSVEVPPDLGTQIGSLAGGIFAFTLDGLGASAISGVAAPLGTLADSIKKWAGVEIPAELGEQLKTLAPGIGAFNFSGWGADAISALAEPLGMLATSVSKWANVEVREDMETVLTSLATGVRAFNFSGWGADDIAEIATPLGDLASSIQKWSGVEIPEEMGPRLSSLATGIKAFDSGFFEGKSKIGDYVEPIGNLASAVSKWNGINIIDNLGTNVGNLADGVKKFNGVGVSNVSGVAKAIKDIGTAVTSISNVNFTSVASGLQEFTSSISNLNVSTDSFANLGNKIVNGLVASINAGLPKVKMVTQSLAHTAINSFTSAVSVASGRSLGAGRALVNGLVSGMKAGTGLVRSVANSIINTGLTTINSKNAAFQSAGRKLATSLTNGIKGASNGAKSAVVSMVSSAARAATSANGVFVSAGLSAASGFASGIRKGAFSATLAAAAMASAAATATRRNLKINSPSKVFRSIGSSVPEGFAQGIGMMGNAVKASTRGMTDTAINSVSKAISHVGEIINSDMVDTQPTIRPVVDLDNVYAGARAINGALSLSPSLGVLSNVRAIGSAMNHRIQNGGNGEVISAIKDLGKAISKSSGTTYNVNGVTYDDGSTVSQAVSDLIRAIKMEERS